ncbi:unnamed protein product [Mytilus coruscus]|uniref:Protein kinase domain-containing protein n=1 Tax=Mytilus coruscus TaxID=42192 RepID=A0A6J8DY33_MYTCO|nr:unnamed protein product [Mytilus coruscus]
MLPSSPISAGMVTSLFSQTSQTSAVMLSSQSLPPLWIEPETKAVQYISSQFTTQPDQLTCHSTQQYIPIINIRNISFDHTDNGNVKVLGKGATAEVLQGNLHSVCSLKKVAIKLYNDQHKDVHYISQEAGILQILNNSNVTPKVFVPSVSHSAWLRIALNICNSLKTIHDAYVLVNDIKTDNIMVNTQDLSIKFIDMGHASHKGGRSFYLPVEEAYRYPHMGPEISSGHLTTKATDIFSLGYLLRIFPASPLKTMGQMCLNPCPAQRPPIEEIIDKISEHMK